MHMRVRRTWQLQIGVNFSQWVLVSHGKELKQHLWRSSDVSITPLQHVPIQKSRHDDHDIQKHEKQTINTIDSNRENIRSSGSCVINIQKHRMMCWENIIRFNTEQIQPSRWALASNTCSRLRKETWEPNVLWWKVSKHVRLSQNEAEMTDI